MRAALPGVGVELDGLALLSAGGTSVFDLRSPCRTLMVGATDGIWTLQRDETDGEWSLRGRALAGTFVSALSLTSRGTIIAGCHHFGIARSDDIGASWKWANSGITQFDVWVVKAERIGDRELVFAGTMPAYLFVSADDGRTWNHCPALRTVKNDVVSGSSSILAMWTSRSTATGRFMAVRNPRIHQ